MDDELVEKVKGALLLTLAADFKPHSVEELARAAIQAVREWDRAQKKPTIDEVFRQHGLG